MDKAQILRLASCSYIQQTQNVIILGATGTGKTHLACAFGLAANRNYYEVKYIRLADLWVEIAVARGSGAYREQMRRYKKVSLLILDEWHASLYEPTMADAICGWIIYNSHTVKIEVVSIRKCGVIAGQVPVI